MTNDLLEQDLLDEHEALVNCVAFHGHLCPGLVYGYRVAQEAMARLGLNRAKDEETVVISENDSCAVDAFQILLGATVGKGNLLLKDYGKNAYTVFDRRTGRALRFIRRKTYVYQSENKAEYAVLEEKMNNKTATEEELKRQKILKAHDLLRLPFAELFDIEEVPAPVMPAFAILAPSLPCDCCGEMTMATRLMKQSDGKQCCIACAQGKNPT